MISKGKTKNKARDIQKTSPLKFAGKISLTRRTRRAQKPIKNSRRCFFRNGAWGDVFFKFIAILLIEMIFYLSRFLLRIAVGVLGLGLVWFIFLFLG